MMTQIDYLSGARPPQLEHNRRAALIGFGVISILIGSFSGCLSMAVPLMFFANRLPRSPGRPPPPTPAAIFQALILFGAVAGGFLWTGIASCRCRRWVRPMIISVGWPGLLYGILAMLGLVVLAPETRAGLRQAGATGSLPSSITMPAMVVLMIVMYVIVPALYLLFYHRRDVEQTLWAYDPEPSWTDRCALPVFVLAVNLVLRALMMVWMQENAFAPFFGRYLTGGPARMYLAAMAALLLWDALLVYRTRSTGWYLAMGLVIFIAANSLATSFWGDKSALIRAMSGSLGGRAAQALVTAKRLWLSVASTTSTAIVSMGYLMAIRSRFNKAPAAAIAPPALET